MAGWKVLTDCLKPGGMMKVGLYSQLARQHIVKFHKIIANQEIPEIPATAKAMLALRVSVLASNAGTHSEIKKITTNSDSFSMSELRDLLFHEQEHRFTLPQIKAHLDALGLTFAGFEFSGKKR